MNNKVVKFLCCVLCILFAGVFCAFGSENIRKTAKVTVKTAYPPQAKTTGTVGTLSSNLKSLWVDVDLSFTTSDVKSSKASPRFIDNPELDVQLVAYYPEKEGKDGKRSVVFSGKVKYWTLEQDGKMHHMKALLPAVLFRRYTNELSADRVIFLARAALSAGGKDICIAYGSSKPLSDKVIHGFFRNDISKAVKVENALFGRSKTPWSMIEVNKYELEKN